jgi:hypothetical protein
VTERRTVEIHIVMDEDGSFVVDNDASVAAERAEEEFGEDAEVRQIALTLEIVPPSVRAEPIHLTCKID